MNIWINAETIEKNASTDLDSKKAAAEYICSSFLYNRKPLARRVVQKKPTGDDEDKKTPFVVQ